MQPLGLNVARFGARNCSSWFQRWLPRRNANVSDTSNKSVKLKISHSALWKDFQAKSRELIQLLEKEFPGKLEVTVEPVKEKSDDFEVFVDQELIHSKRWGDGFADRQCKVQNIANAIKQKLDG